VIIGGVAAGGTAAARCRRMSEDTEITILERGPYVSYANCGLPYYLSGDIQDRSKLFVQTPQGFKSRYNVDVVLNCEVLEIDRLGKRVKTKDSSSSDEKWLSYDKLILAQGANALSPPIPGTKDCPQVYVYNEREWLWDAVMYCVLVWVGWFSSHLRHSFAILNGIAPPTTTSTWAYVFILHLQALL